ncbi:MAG: hypothetical protein ACK5MK_13575, partial [Dysgonomonas sp.]
ATQPTKVVFEDCFIDGVYLHNYNNIAGLFTFKFGADLTIRNTTFMNTRVNLLNLNGAVEQKGLGIFVNLPVPASTSAYASKLTIENVNIINTEILTGIQPNAFSSMINMNVDPSITNATCTINNLVSINNLRSGTRDCDMLLTTATITPTIVSSYFNDIKTTTDTTTTAISGATIDPTLTYASAGIEFEMDGALPKIFINEYGVKYLKRIQTPTENIASNLFKKLHIQVKNGTVTVENLQTNENLIVNDLSGRMVKNIKIDNSTISFTLNHGVYVVRTNNKIAKIVL